MLQVDKLQVKAARIIMALRLIYCRAGKVAAAAPGAVAPAAAAVTRMEALGLAGDHDDQHTSNRHGHVSAMAPRY